LGHSKRPKGAFGLSPSAFAEATDVGPECTVCFRAVLSQPMGREGHPKKPATWSSGLLALFVLRNVAIYTKLGKQLVKESITIDSGCYVGRKAIKIRACIEGQTSFKYFFISDLLADNGRQEIQDVINANSKKA
jgi:hypothetical protein